MKASLFLPKTTFHSITIRWHLIRSSASACRDHYACNRRSVPRRRNSCFDGPPYANGDLHLGRFLNKTLKDMINRWMLLVAGVEYTWMGLPWASD